MINKNYSAIILSAGKSSRMGVPKFSLKFDENTTFLEKLVDVYHSFGCAEIVVVLNDEGCQALKDLKLELPSNHRIVTNLHPEWERFYSLKMGVSALKENNHVFISNIDNPFVDLDTLHALDKNRLDIDYCFPMYKGKGGHPFIISQNIVAHIRQEERNDFHLREYLNTYATKAVDVNSEKILININTMEDYLNYFGT